MPVTSSGLYGISTSAEFVGLSCSLYWLPQSYVRSLSRPPSAGAFGSLKGIRHPSHTNASNTRFVSNRRW